MSTRSRRRSQCTQTLRHAVHLNDCRINEGTCLRVWEDPPCTTTRSALRSGCPLRWRGCWPPRWYSQCTCTLPTRVPAWVRRARSHSAGGIGQPNFRAHGCASILSRTRVVGIQCSLWPHRGAGCANTFSATHYEIASVLTVGLHARHISERSAFFVGNFWSGNISPTFVAFPPFKKWWREGVGRVMGAASSLPEASRRKHTGKGGAHGLEWGVSAMQGHRPTMEVS